MSHGPFSRLVCLGWEGVVEEGRNWLLIPGGHPHQPEAAETFGLGELQQLKGGISARTFLPAPQRRAGSLSSAQILTSGPKCLLWLGRRSPPCLAITHLFRLPLEMALLQEWLPYMRE